MRKIRCFVDILEGKRQIFTTARQAMESTGVMLYGVKAGMGFHGDDAFKIAHDSVKSLETGVEYQSRLNVVWEHHR